MENFKLKIGSSEFEIDENAFNYIKDDILIPKTKITNANFEARTINFEIIHNADPLRTLKFFKMLGETKYQYHRFSKRKKRIIKKRIYKKMKNIKKFKLFVS